MSDETRFRPDDDPRGILASIVDSSDDAIFATDADGIVLTWNRGAERMYGYSASEMVGRSLTILAPDDQAASEMTRARQRVAAGEHVEQQEVVRRTKSGRLLDVSINVTPIPDETGRIVAASTIAHDISDRKRVERALRASEAHWRAIIQSAVDGIIVIDARGTIESFNPAAERLFGYRQVEVLGRNVKMLMPEPYRGEHDGYLARYLTTGQAKIIGIGREVTAIRKDGMPFPVHLAVGEMHIEGASKFTGIIHDLSERVRIETQLREQSALTKLGEMAAVVAHEVKNPLAGIRGAIQVIGGRLPAGSKDGAVIKEIVARLDALNDLMKDLLLFARPPHPKFSPVDLSSLATTVADLVRQDPALNHLRIEIDGAVPVIAGDAEMLKIVLQNLVLNSAHATHGHGTVRIALLATAEGCELTVTDDGPGIPADVRERLFTPFFTTKARGTGLGLSTAKRLIEAHGGTIAIECPTSGGTTVRLGFPVQVT
jgi:two-component system sensor kinase FixL